MTDPSQPPLEVRCYFVRGRNALLTRANFSDLFVEYYLGLADNGQQISPDLDQLFKELLVALSLHAAGRPHAETIAWTMHSRDPLCNLFATVNNTTGAIVGTVFTENIKLRETPLLYSDVVTPTLPPRRSIIPLHSPSPLKACVDLYFQSEQRPARLFCHHDEDYVFLAGQPDCDIEWLMQLPEEEIRTLDRTEELSLLETRHIRWHCGCSEERMMQVLRGPMLTDPGGLFGEDAEIRMRCPRCGKPYRIARSALEQYLLTAR